MKIDSATINFQTSHQASISGERTETLRSWGGNRRADSGSAALSTSSRVSISQSAQFALSMDSRSRLAPTSLPSATAGQTRNDLATAIDAANEAAENDPFLSMIRSMVEMMTGKPIKTFSSADLSRAAAASPTVSRAAPAGDAASAPATQASQAARSSFGAEYERRTVYSESEATRFSASGVIRTQDGQEIQFNLDLQMERSYREETYVSQRFGDAAKRRDPLVINFAGNSARLLDQHFRFDLDNDGQAEEVPMLASGSGYLAFDRNGNGRIDNGSELFGPGTDNGFAELADLDADGNGWIDEADPLFSKLGIWQANGSGDGMELQSLAASGIGALALAHAATPFELRGIGNSNLGGVRSSGIALTEDGKVLSMQEIDLTVR